MAATMLIVTPASAARLETSIETLSDVFDCPSTEDCFRHGAAPEGTDLNLRPDQLPPAC